MSRLRLQFYWLLTIYSINLINSGHYLFISVASFFASILSRVFYPFYRPTYIFLVASIHCVCPLVRLLVCLFICLFSVCLSVGRSVCLSVGRSVCRSVCLSVCLFNLFSPQIDGKNRYKKIMSTSSQVNPNSHCNIYITVHVSKLH